MFHRISAQFVKGFVPWISGGIILFTIAPVLCQPTDLIVQPDRKGNSGAIAQSPTRSLVSHAIESSLIAQVSLPPNIRQFLEDFGLTPTECSERVTSIQLGENTVCVQPSARIAAGTYVYDAATDQIKPLGNSPAVTSPAQPSSSSSPPNPTTATRSGSQPNLSSSYQFDFTNSFDYSNCLEDIIQLYKNQNFNLQSRRGSCLPEVFQSTSRPLTQSQTLDLIRAADTYATSALSPAIYPPRGLRNRIAQEFGYTYALDTQR